jgi:hypothetical protein
MKTDLYTKTILTIIAVALIALFVQNTEVVGTAQAQSAFECADVETICEKIDNVASRLEDIESNTFGYYCGGCPDEVE